MAVEVGIPPGVAGFIQAKDRVSILAQLSLAAGGGQGVPTVRFLLQDIEVLAVGRRVVVTADGQSDGQNQPQDRVLMTLALRPAEAEKLAFAIFQGQLYFTLLPPGAKPVRTPGRTPANAFR
jgi:Flp pilus assembly protein CpaB